MLIVEVYVEIGSEECAAYAGRCSIHPARLRLTFIAPTLSHALGQILGTYLRLLTQKYNPWLGFQHEPFEGGISLVCFHVL